MKSTFIKITLVLLAACSHLSYGQCDKTVVLKSSKTNHLDEKGNIEKSKAEDATITISKSQVTIIPGDEDHTISGAITSKTCEWSTPFKDGKTVVKAKLEDNNGNTQHCTITITGVAGKITLVFESEEEPGKKIMVVADTFE